MAVTPPPPPTPTLTLALTLTLAATLTLTVLGCNADARYALEQRAGAGGWVRVKEAGLEARL